MTPFTMAAEPKPFVIQAYSNKELRSYYDVSWETFSKWLGKIPDLGEYEGKKFTPAQVKKIVAHLGEPNN